MAARRQSEDLFDNRQDDKGKRRIFTVTELTQNIKAVLEGAFPEVWIEGEISGLSRIATGTTFFSLKDSGSVLKSVIFASGLSSIKFELKDGLAVICGGRISVYEKTGQYQFYVDRVEPKGIGSLQLALEQLKEKLQKQGLFSPERKRPIPYLPSRVGIVTSLSGAAIKDMLKVLDRRFKDVHVIVNPVRVQGEGAKEDIAEAIKDFNDYSQAQGRDGKVDVLIVGRGGGSIEDLWAFNEEVVARAIYESKIPVISAVGHERDWTIADMVADVRAATPSVAAELVLPEKEELRTKVMQAAQVLQASLEETVAEHFSSLQENIRRLRLATGHAWEIAGNELDAARNKLRVLNPATAIPEYKRKISDAARQIYVRMQHLLELKRSDLTTEIEKLSGLNPLNILARGYSVTFSMADGRLVKDASKVSAGDNLRTRVHRGELISTVLEVHTDGRDQV